MPNATPEQLRRLQNIALTMGRLRALYGGAVTPNTAVKHFCIDHLEHHTQHQVETHGLDCGPYEEWTDEWDTCKICGEVFDDFDLIELIKEADERAEREAREEDGPDYLRMYKESING